MYNKTLQHRIPLAHVGVCDIYTHILYSIIQLVGAMAMMLRDTQTIPETIMALVDLISVPEILGATHWDDDPESFTFLIRYEVPQQPKPSTLHLKLLTLNLSHSSSEESFTFLIRGI
jgi:hypothetical protein